MVHNSCLLVGGILRNSSCPLLSVIVQRIFSNLPYLLFSLQTKPVVVWSACCTCCRYIGRNTLRQMLSNRLCSTNLLIKEEFFKTKYACYGLLFFQKVLKYFCVTKWHLHMTLSILCVTGPKTLGPSGRHFCTKFRK